MVTNFEYSWSILVQFALDSYNFETKIMQVKDFKAQRFSYRLTRAHQFCAVTVKDCDLNIPSVPLRWVRLFG
jgi:hypothetical protein